jgi:hypothetical protein
MPDDNYVPAELHTTKRTVKFGHGQNIRDARLALGQPRHYGPEPPKPDSVWWAETKPGHWSRHRGHFYHVETGLHTENSREVNDWKGRDEIRGEIWWWIKIDGEQVYEGHGGTDVSHALRSMEMAVHKLADHAAINWGAGQTAAEQLLGRKIWYDRTPAVIHSTSVLHQGCVMIRPDGQEFFPAPVWRRPEEDDPYERREFKVDILSDGRIWWWRDDE